VLSQTQKRNINDIVQYKITNWSTDDGLPSNTVVYLHQDANDYLWIGSYDGLIRFDGSRFTVFTKSNTPEIQSFHARVLVEDRDENLWIGTGSGLVRYKNGKFTNLAEEHTFFIENLLVNEGNQTMWIGTRNSGLFIYDIKANTYTPNENRFSKDLINAIISDGAGGIWVGSEKNGLGHFSNGKWTYYGHADGLLNTEIISLYLDPTDGLLIGTTSGLFKFSENTIVSDARFDGLRVNRIKKDISGNLWVATVSGVHIQEQDGGWKIIDKQHGLSNNDVRDIFFDSEGNIWLATYRGGLNQLKEVKFVTFSEPEGLVVEATGAIQQLDTTTYMVGTTDGKLYTIENGIIKPFPVKVELTNRIYSILKDHKKNIWIATYNGLLLITPDGRERLYTEKDGLPTRQLRVIMQDRNQQYWIGTRPSGLIKMEFNEVLDKPIFNQFQYDKLNELDATFIMSIEEDRKGNLLVATNTGGVVTIAPNGRIQSINAKQGLESNLIYSVRSDADGVMWIATSDGLGRFENGEVFNYTRKDGMPHEGVYDLVEDDQGYAWLPSPKGIIRVSKQQLNEYKEGKIKTIDWKLFDRSNDLIKAEGTGATRMFKDNQGNMWFLMLGGVVAVNPSTLEPNVREPKVFIESLTIDEKNVDLTGSIEIPAGSQRIAFTYAALSLRYPKGVRYKFMVENFDRDWIDAGTGRPAVYTSLPDGSYTFKVIACNNDGVWNTTGASISFVVKPFYYQTSWFIVLVTISLVAAIFIYIRIRTREIKRRATELEQLVEARTRQIASQRDELVVLNEELRSSQEEVMAQRDSLSDKNDEIARMNTNLEKIVAERTEVLEEQNKRLAEYAFINAHKLRAPLASILGIIHLLTIEIDKDQQLKLLELLHKSSAELDEIVNAINKMLEEEFEKGEGKS